MIFFGSISKMVNCQLLFSIVVSQLSYTVAGKSHDHVIDYKSIGMWLRESFEEHY